MPCASSQWCASARWRLPSSFRRPRPLARAHAEIRARAQHLDKPPFDNLVTTQKKLGLLETSALTLTDQVRRGAARRGAMWAHRRNGGPSRARPAPDVSQVYQVHDRVESMLDTYSNAMETLNEVGERERKRRLGGLGALLTHTRAARRRFSGTTS